MEPSLSGKMYVKSPDTSKEIRIDYPSFLVALAGERSEGLADAEWRGGVSRALLNLARGGVGSVSDRRGSGQNLPKILR
jgi:hypothetical protein